ncbi:hypothetical protein MRX96_031066 [Rhipicephalus microplus]
MSLAAGVALIGGACSACRQRCERFSARRAQGHVPINAAGMNGLPPEARAPRSPTCPPLHVPPPRCSRAALVTAVAAPELVLVLLPGVSPVKRAHADESAAGASLDTAVRRGSSPKQPGPCAAARVSMLSLRQPDYLSPLCGGGGSDRKVRSASEGGPDWASHERRTARSIIQLGSGLLKKVEDLRTEDFVSSANLSRDLRIDSSRVLRVAEAPSKGDGVALLSFSVGQNQVQVTVEAPVEHPFFVFNRGWSSCNPERSLQRYQLQCHRLSVGDVCISLTHRARRAGLPPTTAPLQPLGADPMNPLSIREPAARKRRWSAPDQVAPVSERTT